jgi:hypothetical protein
MVNDDAGLFQNPLGFGTASWYKERKVDGTKN